MNTAKVRFISLLLVVSATDYGCSVVRSYRSDMQGPHSSGVSYYLPRKDVIVTLTSSDPAKPPSYALTDSEYYPDLSSRFVARFRRTWIGTDSLRIGVNSKGLLNSSTNADFSSQLPAILANVARAAGTFGAMGMAEEPPAPGRTCACTGKGVFAFRLDPANPPTEANNCGFRIEATPLGSVNIQGPGLSSLQACGMTCKDDGSRSICKKTPCTAYNGFFYRNAEPYLVTIDKESVCGPATEAIVFSPNAAPLEFVKVERGLFANANASFDFDNGTLKTYSQVKNSEILALSALPADLAKAYFEAVGKMFELRTTAVTNESGYEKAIAGLLLQQEKTRACQAALAAGDQAAIDASCK